MCPSVQNDNCIRYPFWLLTGLFLLISSAGVAQNFEGIPLIRNYPPQEYASHRQNWEIAQAPNQVMYFANGKGVLQFDGEDWALIMMPNKGHVRSLEVSSDGTVYVGANNDFGRLQQQSNGTFSFESFLHHLPEEDQNMGKIYSTEVLGETVYWQAYDRIYRWKNGAFKQWKFEERIRRLFICKGQVYINGRANGLLRLNEADEFASIPGGEATREMLFEWVIPSGDGLLLGSLRKGILYYDGQEFKPFKTDLPFDDGEMYAEIAVYLPGNLLAVAPSVGQGLYILDQQGQIIRQFTTREGLQNNDVLDLYLDQQNGLWCGLQEGLSRVDVMAPFEVFNERSGLQGTVQAIQVWKDRLYAGTGKGLEVYETIQKPGQFRLISGTEGYVWSIKALPEHLMVATGDGLYAFDGKEAQLVDPVFTTGILASSYHPSHVFTSSSTGIRLFESINGQFQQRWGMEEMTGSIRDIVEVKQGQFWLKTRSNGLISVQIPSDGQGQLDFDKAEARFYQQDKGVPAGENNIFLIEDQFVICTEAKTLYSYNPADDRFAPYGDLAELLGIEYEGKLYPILGGQARPGVYWLENDLGDRRELLKATKGLDGRFQLQRFPSHFRLSAYTDLFSNEVFHASEQALYYGGMKGIIQYQYEALSNQPPGFQVYINKIQSRDSLLSESYSQSADPIELPFGLNDLNFDYCATQYQQKDFPHFQYFLEGYDPSWSEWTSRASKNYTNLSDGNYSFRVRARNGYGQVVEADACRFVILAPWYRSWWAMLAYILGGMVLLLLSIRLRSQQLRRQNQLLEAEVRERTQTIQQQADELAELNQVKSRFFANISHELRTPLTLIMSPVDDLLRQVKSADKRQPLILIKNNSRRLLKLINQLLDLSKLDADKLELRASEADIVSYCRQLTYSFATLADQNNQLLEFQSNVDSLFLYFDEQKMEQILLNLLSNAFKFTPAKGKISVAISRKPSEQSVQIRISDTGIGISEEQLPYVFDRFYQADDDDTRLFSGTGIGLSLTKELVELHQGEIQVSSQKDKGSTFTLRFPLGKAHLKEDQIWIKTQAARRQYEVEDFTVANTEEVASPIDQEAPLLLIADDHDELRQYIALQLQDRFRILEAKDGKEAWELALEQLPDIILSDVMMPNMSGYQLCAKIKGDFRTNHIPLILLTAKSGQDEKLKGLEQQADAYLTKPFNTEELRLRVDNMILLRNRLRQRFAGQILFETKEVAATSREEKFLQQLSDILEDNISNAQFGVDECSQAMGMSRSQLNRKLRALLDKSTNQYIRSYRLARARQLLEKDSGTIAEIAYDTGFSSPAYFSKCFTDEFGYSPKAWKSSRS